MSEDQGSSAREIVNYDDITDYEPRQTRFGNIQLWGRGIPRAPLVYAIVLTVALLLVSAVPVLGAPLHLFSGGRRFLECVAIASGLAWWAWEIPPGGVRPHRALSSIASEFSSPWHRHGWVGVAGEVEHLRPAPLPMEPDFSGRWPRVLYTGPGLLVRIAPAQQERPRQRRGRRDPARRLRQAPELEPGRPQALQIPAGVSVELVASDRPKEA